jgi:molybdate transport system substrate-binding protein
MMRRPPAVLAAALAAAAVLAGCGGDGGAAPPDGLSGRVTVFAAASLVESFNEIGQRFEEANPGTEVEFSFGASSGLATQITEGAPADVFASASPATMDRVSATEAAQAPRIFAENQMQIAVPPDNPAGIATLADLARPGVKVALCAPEVPCGTVAREVFRKAGVTVTPVTDEQDVKATLTKVQLGEVDAGLVYATDVKAAGVKVKGIAIPDDVNAVTPYPITTIRGSGNPDLAKAFVDHVLSADGAAVLADAGFRSL